MTTTFPIWIFMQQSPYIFQHVYNQQIKFWINEIFKQRKLLQKASQNVLHQSFQIRIKYWSLLSFVIVNFLLQLSQQLAVSFYSSVPHQSTLKNVKFLQSQSTLKKVIILKNNCSKLSPYLTSQRTFCNLIIFLINNWLFFLPYLQILCLFVRKAVKIQ